MSHRLAVAMEKTARGPESVVQRRSRWLLGLVSFLALPLLAPTCDMGDLRRRVEEHVLNRTGFGPDPWSRARIEELGPIAYIEEQLHPETLDDSELEASLLARFRTLGLEVGQIRTQYNEYLTNPDRLIVIPRRELYRAKILRAVYSKRQLEQVLVDFWFNHFNVDALTKIARWATGPYERDAIRPYVLGSFRDMLRATAGHPAMLDYLDNARSFREGYARYALPLGLNENYAREILELHTVGVDFPYTLTDIQTVARAFTGWTIERDFLYRDDGFVFLEEGHDTSAKQLLGGQLEIPPGGGIEDGEAVIDFLATHPATAAFVSRKLCQRFVSEDPPESLVSHVAGVFQVTQGDLRAVTRAVLTSQEFLAPAYHRSKLKRPLHYVASLARAVGVVDDEPFGNRAVGEMRRMGEAVYEAAPPTGHPDVSSAWGGQGPFLFRLNLAAAAVNGDSGFEPVTATATEPREVAEELARRLLLANVRPETLDRATAVAESLPSWAAAPQAAAVLLSSPEFMRH